MQNKYRSSLRALLSAGLAMTMWSPLWADQYLTDTPQTMDYEQVEADIFASLTQIRKDSIGVQVPALEANIGVMNDFQARFSMPVVLTKAPHVKATYGYGDIELGAKARFIHETETFPQIAFYPRINFPSGKRGHGGSGGELFRFPLWFQKNWGEWQFSGGGGYALTTAPHAFNFAYGGVLLRNNVTKKLNLGIELFAQGARNLKDHSTLILNFGATYNFTSHIFLLAGIGHSVAGLQTLKGFLGLGMTWGPESSPRKRQEQPSI